MENIIIKKSSNEFQNDMKCLVNNSDFADVVFKLSEGSIVYGHKVIISKRSPYFHELFSDTLRKKESMESVESVNTLNTGNTLIIHKSAFSEENFNNFVTTRTNITEVNFDSLTENVMISILEFLYTGTFSNNLQFNEIIDVLRYSNEFGLKELKSLCENNLIYGMDTKNIIEVLIASHQHGLSDLKNLSISFILNNFQEVSKQKTFFKLEAFPQLLMEVMMLSLGKIEVD